MTVPLLCFFLDAELPTLDKEDHDGVHEIDVPWLDLPDTRVRTHADCTDCWLCGRWVEHHITWDNTHNLPVGKVFVHLQCDQFEPHELEVGKKPAWPSIKRFVFQDWPYTICVVHI